MSKKNIFLGGYYGFGNTGDEAILSTIYSQLRAQYSNSKIIVSSGNPEATIRDHDVESVAWNNISEIEKTIQICDIVIIGGGGLFHDYWGLDPSGLLTDSHWGITYYADIALLAAIHRKPLMLYAVGVGPLYSEHGKKFTRVVCDIAQCITVRDDFSKVALEQIGVDSSRIHVTADPAFSFHPGLKFQLHQGIGTDFIPHKPLIGVAVRKWTFGVCPEFFERELALALDIYLRQTDGSVVFFPFQDLRGEHEDDRAVTKRIQAQMQLASRTAIFKENASADEIYCSLRQCDLVVGMRLHALIFAAMNRVPLVVLSYDPKTYQMAGELGLGQWLINVDAFQASELVRKMHDAVARWPDFAKLLGNAIGRLVQASAETPGLALELLQHSCGEFALNPETTSLLVRGIRAQIAHSEGLNQRNRALTEEKASIANALLQAQQWAAEQARLLTEAQERQPNLEEEATRAALHRSQELAAENAILRQELETLRAGLQQESIGRQQAQSMATAHHQALQETRQTATKLLSDLDRYREIHDHELAVYRSQRAWQVMLLFRKAYSLLMRGSKTQALSWLLKLPLGRIGSLAEYDLRFPSITDYMSDHAHAVLTASDAAEAAPVKDKAAALITPHAPPPQKHDVIILGIIDFDFRFQRPQQIAAELAHQGHRVFWVSPTRFLAPDSALAYEAKPLRQNLWEIHLRGPQPDIYMGALEERHLAPLSASLLQLLREWAVSENVVMAQLPFWRQLALALRAGCGSKVLYDCMDDWETFPNIGAFNISEEKLLTREADILVVTAAELAHKYSALGLNPVLVRNATDYRFFASAEANSLLAGIPHPIVGYFGAIADWIDLDLVYEVAKLRGNYSFVMIGQVFDRDISQLQSLPNVYLLGSKGYEDIPFYLYHFDACTIPFLINQVTKATDPVKLYEYFALGKPVVATAMAELEQCAKMLYIGHNANEFACHLDQAIAESDGTLRQQRIEFAKANTWERRVNDINSAVAKSFHQASILIVTHNSEAFVRPCLDSILKYTTYPNYEVIVVDNASSDGTPDILFDYARQDPRIHVTRSEVNLGFAGGNNLAAEKAGGELLLLLNIDTIVTPGWIGRLAHHIQSDPSIGLICPVTNFAGNEAKINIRYSNCGEMLIFAQNLSSEKYGERSEVRVAPLFCALLTRAVWNQVGNLDTRFAVGMFEDDDYSMRIWQAQYRVVVAEDCFIHHFGQGSFSKLSETSYNDIFIKNKQTFEEKWQQSWKPHKPRVGVRPAHEEERFTPQNF